MTFQLRDLMNGSESCTATPIRIGLAASVIDAAIIHVDDQFYNQMQSTSNCQFSGSTYN